LDFLHSLHLVKVNQEWPCFIWSDNLHCFVIAISRSVRRLPRGLHRAVNCNLCLWILKEGKLQVYVSEVGYPYCKFSLYTHSLPFLFWGSCTFCSCALFWLEFVSFIFILSVLAIPIVTS
jgi:hypothetical protein